MSPDTQDSRPRDSAQADRSDAHDDRARKTKGSEERLDKAIKDTFPASDPIAPGNATGDDAPQSPIDRKTPRIDHGLVERLAEDVRRNTD